MLGGLINVVKLITGLNITSFCLAYLEPSFFQQRTEDWFSEEWLQSEGSMAVILFTRLEKDHE